MSEWKETEIGSIPVEWDVTTLDEVSKVVTDGSHFSPKEVRCGRYMASVKDMRYSGFDFSACKQISEKDYIKLKNGNCAPEYGDILISKDGANCLDIIFVYTQPEKIVLLSSIAIVRPTEENDSFFYRYFLLSPACQHIMRNWFISGSAIPRVVLKNFKKVPVPKVVPQEQKAIAAVLSTIDNKIDLLRRQNATLEHLAQTLFTRWFVEFEFPNEAGQSYKSSGGAMVASEFGEIPAGWKVAPLGEILQLNYGKSLKTENRTEGEFPVIGSSGVVGTHNEYLVKAPGIVIGRKGTIGKVIWLDKDFFPIDTTFYVTDNLGVEDLFFHYFVLKQQSFKRLLSDSAVPGLNRNLALSIEEVIPALSLIEQFSQAVRPIFNKLFSNSNQIQTLTRLRDTLLPKLMNGQIRVQDV